MTDPALFASGALVTQDYLIDGITTTRQWKDVDARVFRARLADIFDGFPHTSRPNEPTTESDLIWPVLEALGWQEYLTQQNLSATGRVDVPDGLLFIDGAAKQRANGYPEEWKRYQFGAAVVESKRWGRALDRAEGRTEKDTPSTQLLRYLRRVDDLTNGDLRWGILTNGAKWRLYYAGARSTIDDYLELDLSRIMGLDPDLLDAGVTDEERDHWLSVFVTMFSRTAFERPSAGAPSFHDIARREAAFYEERVAKSLSDLVFDRLYPTLGKAVASAAPADTPLDDVREATLILLYRLLFILYAEDRGLLPVRDKRFDDYALRDRRLDVGARKDKGDAFSHVSKNIWHHFANLAEMIDKGDPSVGLPPYNGGLFNADQTPLLKTIALGDDVMAEAIDILSFEQHDGRRRYINYRDLTVQQLGSIYERLLEFELMRDADGALDIRPNLFARKNSGSYYTPDDLVLLIIDETLEPLIADAMAAFEAELNRLKPKDSEDYRIAQLQKVDPARAIVRLRICDPAMGSGHFLVSLVDRLTNHTLDAMAEAAVMAQGAVGDLDYESPVAEDIRKIRATIRHNAEDAGWSVSEEQLDDPQLIKRMVLKRCVYGADKNPMAVELAKVALWLHTFTVGAPLSFIDHHLAAGDSLFGLWVRDAIDKAGASGELLYIDDLRNAERQASVMRRIEALTDAEIAEAHDSAKMWHEVEAQTGPLDGFVSFVQALDWLALKTVEEKEAVRALFDGQFGDPIAIMRGRTEPAAKVSAFPSNSNKDRMERQKFNAIDLLDSITKIVRDARKLIGEELFLNWQITFPGVWQNWASAGREGGFDAVIGNPPWDRIKLQQVEWFAARRPAIAKAQRASDRKAMIARLKAEGDPLYGEYEIADRRAADTARMARKSGHYPLLSRGDINLYSLFVERARSLVKPNGMIGLLTPSGIAADLSASAFFSEVSTGGHLKALYDFENKKIFFPDVHASFKFCILSFSPERQFAATKCAFYLHSIGEMNHPDRAFPITAADFARVNPNTGTAPIFRSRRDMQLTTDIYARLPVLVDRSVAPPVAAWPVKYSTMFHMTNDSHLFRTQAELAEKEGAWPVGGNRWQSSDGEWVPLYAGRMIHQFDHRAASVTVNEENLHNAALSGDVTADMKADPSFVPTPQYWVKKDNLASVEGATSVIVFRDIARATDARTVISAIAPAVGFGNKAPLILGRRSQLSASDSALLTGNLNAICLDFIARSKVQSTSLNWYIVEQLPVVPPAAYDHAFGSKTAAEIVRAAVLELTYTANDMAPFARDMDYVNADGAVKPPFVWDEDRRLHLRAKLDALYFILYGVYDPADPAQSRDDIAYIYSTFPIVERQETAAWGRYRSRDLCLAYVNALIAGQPEAVVVG